MNAYTIVHGWAAERAHELRRAAEKAETAYSKDPMAGCCRLYAASLRRAAKDLDETARVILGSSPAGGDDNG